jgi:cytochrome c556
VVDVSPAQAALIRRTMRTNVEDLDGVLRASAAGDVTGVGRAARLVLAEAPRIGNPALVARLPADWQAQSAAVQQGFGRLVQASDGGSAPSADLAAQLAPITAACVTCHQEYRLP